MERLNWHLVKDIETLQQNSFIKCVGIVTSIVKQYNFVSFVVSDMTSTLEATLYDDEKSYLCLDLPKIGNSIILMGYTFKKQMGGETHILKLKLKMFRIINKIQQFMIIENMLLEEKEKQQSNYLNQFPKTTKTKRPLLKQLKFAIEPLQVRTLILSCVYITLENNIDLESYIFTLETIQKHRLTKSFLEIKKIKEEGNQYLKDFIQNGLNYLIDNHFVEKKDEISGTKLFKINRKIFIQIEMRMIGLINSKSQNRGIVSREIVEILNKDYGFVAEKNFAFNQSFIQRMLKKFIQQGKIYKTEDKILYPNVSY